MSIFSKNPPRVHQQEKTTSSVFQNNKKRKSPEQFEMERILRLPVVRMLEGDDLEEACRDLMLSRPFNNGKRLFQTQASAIRAYDECGGGFFPIGVGWGKTLISLAIADHAYLKGFRKILLLIPPSVVGQLVKVDIPWARGMIPLNVPFHILGGRSRRMRQQMAESGRSGCYIMPYSLLSTTDANDVLTAIDADCVIADEGHQLKNRRSGKTKRLLHFMRERAAPPEVTVMSGTITSKGIDDYHHLIVPALKNNVPVPRSANMAWGWGQIIDSGSVIQSQAQTGPLLPIMRWAKRVEPAKKFKFNVSGFRDAYRLRLTTAPGVVATGDNEIGVSFGIENDPVQNYEESEGWLELNELMRMVQEEFVTPNGDEIDHALHTFKWMLELSAGFFNELIWPTPEELSTKRGISQVEARELLEASQKHHAAQQDYNKMLRRFLQESPIGMDTPMEVARLINQDPKRLRYPDLVDAYWTMENLVFEGMPQRYGRAVRVCPYKIDGAVSWARQNADGCILWVYHQEVGKWLVEALQAAGLDPLYCPAGANDEITAVGDPKRGGKGDRITVASIAAHQVGKNLQAFQKQRFVQWPRGARMAEQVLGRLHRNGQEADYVAAVVSNTIIFDHVLFAACLNDAIYTHQSTGPRQKMVYATYDPLPMIFSPEFLREQGSAAKILTAEQRQMLHERFGDYWLDAAK